MEGKTAYRGATSAPNNKMAILTDYKLWAAQHKEENARKLALRKNIAAKLVLHFGDHIPFKRQGGSHEDDRPLPLCVSRPDLDSIRTLLLANRDDLPDINVLCPPNSETLLHVACRCGYLDLATYVLLEGADPDIATAKGKTALHLAAAGGYTELVRILLMHGANVNARRKCGSTPLHAALEHRHESVCKELILGGADVTLSRYVILIIRKGKHRGEFRGDFTKIGNKSVSLRRAKDGLIIKNVALHRITDPNEQIEIFEKNQLLYMLIEEYPLLSKLALDSFVNPLLRMKEKIGKIWTMTDFDENWGSALSPRETAGTGSDLTPKATTLDSDDEDYQEPTLFDETREDDSDDDSSSSSESSCSCSDSREPALLSKVCCCCRKIEDRPKVLPLSLLQGFGRKVIGKLHVGGVGNALFGPKEMMKPGLLVEYSYLNMERENGVSPYLELIVKTNARDMVDHPLISRWLDYKWKSFGETLFVQEVMMYTIFAVSICASTYLYTGDVDFLVEGCTSLTSLRAPCLLRDLFEVIVLLLSFYFAYHEGRELQEQGYRMYFSDSWNWYDLVQLILVWIGIPLRLLGTHSQERTLFSVLGPMTWCRFLYYARAFKSSGPFVRVLFKMVSDIARFMVLLLLFLWSFSQGFYVLQVEGYETPWRAALQIFQLNLGDWDIDAIKDSDSPIISLSLWLMSAMIGPILLINLLIAMMNKSYEQVVQVGRQEWRLQQAEILLTLQSNMRDELYASKYLVKRLLVFEEDYPIEGVRNPRQLRKRMQAQKKLAEEQVSPSSPPATRTRSALPPLRIKKTDGCPAAPVSPLRTTPSFRKSNDDTTNALVASMLTERRVVPLSLRVASEKVVESWASARGVRCTVFDVLPAKMWSE